ncbi:hypothetical protein Tco_0722532 [Tanacetum coccineum]
MQTGSLGFVSIRNGFQTQNRCSKEFGTPFWWYALEISDRNMLLLREINLPKSYVLIADNVIARSLSLLVVKWDETISGNDHAEPRIYSIIRPICQIQTPAGIKLFRDERASLRFKWRRKREVRMLSDLDIYDSYMTFHMILRYPDRGKMDRIIRPVTRRLVLSQSQFTISAVVQFYGCRGCRVDSVRLQRKSALDGVIPRQHKRNLKSSTKLTLDADGVIEQKALYPSYWHWKRYMVEIHRRVRKKERNSRKQQKHESQQKRRTRKQSKKSQQSGLRMTSKTLQQVSKQEESSKQARDGKQESSSKSRQARVGKQETASKSRQARVGKQEIDSQDQARVGKQESASKRRQARDVKARFGKQESKERIDKQASISKKQEQDQNRIATKVAVLIGVQQGWVVGLRTDFHKAAAICIGASRFLKAPADLIRSSMEAYKTESNLHTDITRPVTVCNDRELQCLAHGGILVDESDTDHDLFEEMTHIGVVRQRNKVQEDFKETLVKKIDAFADQLIGRNVVLELFSLDIDPKVTPDTADNSGPFFDVEPLQKRNKDDQDLLADELAQERDLLASLIEKLKCEIDDSKNRNKFLETSNKALVDKLKGEIEDFKTKNKSLESSNNHFKEANNELSKTNQLMFKDLKKFQAELDRYHDVNYASKVAIDCAKAKGDLMSYKIESEKSSNEYTRKINDLNQTISDMKKELFAHQETISIMSQKKRLRLSFTKLVKTKNLIRSLL